MRESALHVLESECACVCVVCFYAGLCAFVYITMQLVARI